LGYFHPTGNRAQTNLSRGRRLVLNGSFEYKKTESRTPGLS
jgi:hypothetical protein